MYSVYILEHYSNEQDEKYYIGYSKNAFLRIMSHLWGTGSVATFKYGVKRIVYIDLCETEREARDVELVYRDQIRNGWIPQQDCSFITVEGLGLLSLDYFLDEYDKERMQDRFLA